MAYQLTEATSRRLTRIATEAQRASRTPALAAGVALNGALLWDAGIGTADLTDPGVELGPDTQFLVASNTKTFTAAMIMQLRDAGKLSLDDTVDARLPEAEHPLTIRQLLAHTGGLAREPVGDIWESGDFLPDPVDPVENFNAAKRILPAQRLWHYSNLAYMVLGEMVGRIDGRSWIESLQARLLDPLELRRTSVTLSPPAAGRYYVPEFSDVPVDEPLAFLGPTLPAGGLASTVADLARWHAFLLEPDAAVLSPDTVEEMRQPQMTADASWQRAYGLGLYLRRVGERIWFGHTGGAPGGITAAFSNADSGISAIVLTNQTSAKDPAGTAMALGGQVLDHDPPPLDPWVAGTEVPDELEGVLGLWFSEGSPVFFAVRQGQLEVRGPADGPGDPPATFRRESADHYVTTSGFERGEPLVIHRRDDGSVWQLNWSTYPFTRAPLAFGQPNPDRPD